MYEEEIRGIKEKTNLEDERLCFIQAVKNDIVHTIKGDLKDDMRKYREKFGFDEEDYRIWLSYTSFSLEYCLVGTDVRHGFYHDGKYDDSESKTSDNLDSDKVNFINSIMSSIGKSVEKILGDGMSEYKELFGFGEEDFYLWLSSSSFSSCFTTTGFEVMKEGENDAEP